jgi:ryanodine receptor 2
LEKFFLPVSSKISLKADEIYNKELSIRLATRNSDATERESAEGELQKDYEILIRDIYAFYPLLIKYVDLHKGFWIKNPDENSEKLYYNVAEVFNLWLKSKIFQKEEKTFVSQNEIDNMLLIMPSSSSGISAEHTQQQPQAENAHAKGKKRRGKGGVKKFTSLVVASLRRLIQIGINFFGGGEQELIQMAKQKFIQIAYSAKIANSADFLLNKDQEDVVEDFIRRYLKSSAEAAENNTQVANETIDKETYQKTKWQRMLYKKIGSKRNLVTTMVNLSQDQLSIRIMDISKVLFGLHMVEHPQVKSSGILRKLVSGQRKKAIMGCFRMAPLYSIANHRAINIFLKSYKTNWLDNEAENDTDIACLIPDLCPQAESAEVSSEGAAAAPEANGGEEKKEGEEGAVVVAQSEKPDPLRQLITTFNYAATTDSGTGNNLAGDLLYMSMATIMSKSCVIEEEEEESGGGGEEASEDAGNPFEEQEMKKQKLLFEQNRLAARGVAEMVLLYISASKGEKTEMLEKTLQLGISLLHGGNVECQHRMLNHLREKKDSGFFTSLAGLMTSCTVLDLDTFERCLKAEQFGGKADGDGSGMAGKKNLHDADFTCSIFRFLQLLCEGHNLEFQNYLRAQPGNNTIVNTIICTVDYLLRLQESMMDFYWHYSGKSTVDDAGKENFSKAISIASQVFNTLTEFMQGPCVGNQLTLANSRLWDAIGGFLMIFANMQEKLSRDPSQIDFLRELMSLQKDMIIMLLSMLEGNVLNGPIGKQMVDTLIENQQNVEAILKFFDIFLKMKDLTSSESFLEFDTNGDGIISPKEFRKAMEAQKAYSADEIDYVLQTVDANQDGKIDFHEISERFHNPAKDIGFNMAVLLTNLSEHMSHDSRLDRLIKKASSFINFFEPFLGRIEITGSSGRIERVYFEIKESNLEQWEKPQIKDSKRQFLFDIVNEGDAKEKLEHFVNFCEDTIFEMQHAASISPEEAAPLPTQENTSVFRKIIDTSKEGLFYIFEALSPAKMKSTLAELKKLTKYELFKLFLKTNVDVTLFIIQMIITLTLLVFRCLYLMTLGGQNASGGTVKQEKSALAQLIQSETISNSRLNLAISDGSEGSGSGSEEHANKTTEQINEITNGIEMGSSSSASEPMVHEETQASSGNEASHAADGAKTEHETKHEESGAEGQSADGEGHAASAASSGINFKNVLSTMARNFYKLKYLALVLAFLINFLMLFYKARALGGVGGDESMSTDILSAEEGGEEEELIEIIMMDPDEYYIEYFLKILAFIHSLVAFAMMVAYYVLKVPLVIFKREKEVARKLEFEGLWIAEQPSEDDLRSHWDKLVISTATYPEMYWDKFVKKKVKNKYAEQFDFDHLCKLLGINAKSDEYKVDESNGKKGKVVKAPETKSIFAK